MVGSLVSGTFLMAIAVLDFFILRGILDVWRKTKSGRYDPQELDDLMTQRGFINRIMGSRWRRFISDSWQMYPVGVLFGLGFDTATEVGLLAITAAAATGHTGGGGHEPALRRHHRPAPAVHRRDVAHGHHRRRGHGQGVRLGLQEPAAQGLLQPGHRLASASSWPPAWAASSSCRSSPATWT